MLNGAAAGGGLALALACDLRIASDQAKLAYAYGTIGLAGDFGINWLLARLTGPGRARSIAFGGPVGAADAFRLGLVDEVVEAGALACRTIARARALAEMSAPALTAIKRNLDAASLGFAQAGKLEAESFLALRGGPEHRAALERLMAAFAARK
ncbi:MAG: enoyl-CoA hydratase-related protein [Novosphingobium sp.]|nr:enoyl-CoA hydratase-related protein [Novosphingobium sp.]